MAHCGYTMYASLFGIRHDDFQELYYVACKETRNVEQKVMSGDTNALNDTHRVSL